MKYSMEKTLTFDVMKNYQQYAVKTLKEAGYKITRQRRTIVELLEKTDKALSPYDMRDMLQKQNINADVVTIYRILEAFEGLSLVHKVLALNGYIRCSREKINERKNSCHHYLLCKSCHKVDEVEGENLTKLEHKIETVKKFSIDSHYLEFTGLCNNCKLKASQ